jgi:hypothetical protein
LELKNILEMKSIETNNLKSENDNKIIQLNNEIKVLNQAKMDLINNINQSHCDYLNNIKERDIKTEKLNNGINELQNKFDKKYLENDKIKNDCDHLKIVNSNLEKE